MPELPEVETIRKRLAPFVVGRRLEGIDICDPRLTRPFDPGQVAQELEDERIEALERRGKYLVFRFRSGRVLLMHLRMTGSLHYEPDGIVQEDPYRRAVLRLDNGSDVGYRDVRRFGTWVLLEPGELDPYLSIRLGAEPLTRNFTTRFLEQRLAGRRAPVKAALLDQRTVAGLGNIYADEALWRARIHPQRQAATIDQREIQALRRGIRQALRVGIARQGSSLRDYVTPDGTTGSMQRELNVYGREGEPCPRCGTPIEKIRAAGRGTWYCPACQRLGSDGSIPRGATQRGRARPNQPEPKLDCADGRPHV